MTEKADPAWSPKDMEDWAKQQAQSIRDAASDGGLRFHLTCRLHSRFGCWTGSKTARLSTRPKLSLCSSSRHENWSHTSTFNRICCTDRF